MFLIAKILLLLYTIISIWYICRNISLFQWHCKNIYPFDTKLSKIELEYIYRCMHISFLEFLRPFFIIQDPIIKRYSFYTYSHIIQNTNINSSRIAYGSVIFPSYIYPYAKKVLQERNIECELHPNTNLSFYGLGWDIKQNHCKIYFRYKNKYKLPKEFQSYITEDSSIEGLVSITYTNSIITERKVYSYLENKETLLSSEKRKVIQKDCNYTTKHNLNETGIKLCKKYKEKNIVIDTINYQDKDNYTIYFPYGF